MASRLRSSDERRQRRCPKVARDWRAQPDFSSTRRSSRLRRCALLRISMLEDTRTGAEASSAEGPLKARLTGRARWSRIASSSGGIYLSAAILAACLVATLGRPAQCCRDTAARSRGSWPLRDRERTPKTPSRASRSRGCASLRGRASPISTKSASPLRQPHVACLPGPDSPLLQSRIRTTSSSLCASSSSSRVSMMVIKRSGSVTGSASPIVTSCRESCGERVRKSARRTRDEQMRIRARSHEVFCPFALVDEGLVRVIDPPTPRLGPPFALALAREHVGVDFLLHRQERALEVRRVDRE